MKIRNGFVSNSSSSSFLIKAKKDKNPMIKIEVEVKEIAEDIIDSKDKLIDFYNYIHGEGTLHKNHRWFDEEIYNEYLNH